MHREETQAPDRTLTALTWIVLALTLGPIGTAAFVLGFMHGESPCILCWAQRTGMVLIGLTGLFILRFGPRPRYVGLAVVLAAVGTYMGLRHSALHVARDIAQGFSGEILGAHTNTWSLFIFWGATVVMGVLVMTLGDGRLTRRVRELSPLETAVGWIFLVAVAGNAVQAFASTGPPPFVGQSDPVRFSFNPAHWVWSLDEYAPAPFGFRGRFLVPHPDTGSLDTDSAHGPFSSPVPLVPAERGRRLPDVAVPVSGLAYDPTHDRFLVTTDHEVSLVDGGLSRRLAHVVVDPGFSVDLGRFGGAAFLEEGRMLALSENKSWVVLREDPGADAGANWRFFLVPGPFAEESRGRFATVRARMAFVRAVAFDPASRSIFTVTVPNPRSPRMVVSRFDRTDMTLSQEFLPSAGGGPALRPGATINTLEVAAATMHGGRLWALSASYATLVAIGLNDGRITAAYTIPGLERPAGLAVRNDRFVIASEDATVTTVPVPPDPDSP